MTVHHNDVYDNTDGIGLYTTENSESAGTTRIDNVATTASSPTTDATNNVIEHNKLTDNNEFDCDDVSTGPYNAPALVANRWVQDSARRRTGPASASTATP